MTLTFSVPEPQVCGTQLQQCVPEPQMCGSQGMFTFGEILQICVVLLTYQLSGVVPEYSDARFISTFVADNRQDLKFSLFFIEVRQGI